MMFSRFTERAQKVIAYAQEEAADFKHGFIGTEHILLGILRDDGGIAKNILITMGVTTEKVKEIIEELEGYGEIELFKNDVPLTPRTKRLLEVSLVEAKNIGHNYISPEHILLAYCKECEGLGNTILVNLKVNLDKLRELVLAGISSGVKIQSPMSKSKVYPTPTLNQYGRDLTELAEQGNLDPVIGRNSEMDRLLEILCRRTKNNPCLIGDPGVGKTAIIEGLAQRIVDGNVPEILKGKRVVTLDLSSMVAGAKYRGEFEDRLKKVMEEIRRTGKVLLFIDEIHTIIGAGAAEGAIDASNILKPSLARGEIQCIGATTTEEYRKHIEKDSALERRFQSIVVGEPTVEEAILILRGLRDKYEAHHRVKITDKAIEDAVVLSNRYITDRYLPDKAIDLIDEAGAKLRIAELTAPTSLKELEYELEKVTKEKEEAIGIQNFEKAARLRDNEKHLQDRLSDVKDKWLTTNNNMGSIVTEEQIATVISKWTNIPVEKLTESESEKLLNLGNILKGRVIGQDEAVEAIAKAVRRGRVGLKDPNRPIGSFIFLGPTGVGKTELCKSLAETMFSSERNIIRIDMSEFMEKHATSKLIGSPPGYVGFDDGGQLTEKVKRNPYSVVLFDEIEKAHPDTFNLLLQILEDGHITDSRGKRVSFKNTIIIMTSNAGVSAIKKQKYVGFNASSKNEREIQYEKMKETLTEEIKKTFRPEFLNRVDDIIIFKNLEKEDIRKVVDVMTETIKSRLCNSGINISFTNVSKDKLSEDGFNLEYGARPLRRLITKEIEDKISEEILRGTIKIGDSIQVDVNNNEFTFKATSNKIVS